MAKDFKKSIQSAGLGGLIPTGKSKETASLDKIRAAVSAMKREGKLARPGRPKRTDKDNEAAPSAERGTKPGETRKTYLVTKELDGKVNKIAYWDRRTVKEVINEALSNYIAAWEKKNGPVDKIKSK